MQNISTNFRNFISFLKWIGPTKKHSVNENLFVVLNLTQRTVKFSKICCVHGPLDFIVPAQIIKISLSGTIT